jgi:hypothetical protein
MTMKLNKMKLKFGAAVLAATMSLGITAFAASGTITYKDISAEYSLKCDFGWKIFKDDDSAKADTKMVGGKKSGHRVACRLEMWEDSSGVTTYKYESDDVWAQCNITYSDVYCFKSRHSIDNSNNTKELVVKALSEKEPLN